MVALQTLDHQRTDDIRAAGDPLATAVDEGTLGDFVIQNNRLINSYYDDVLKHVQKSYKVAQRSAIAGMVLFGLSIAYVFVVDWLHMRNATDELHTNLDALKELAKNHIPVDNNTLPNLLKLLGNKHHYVTTVAWLGAFSGCVAQLFAGVAFYLYQKVSDQFSAFHICLERTHRYLVAYKMVEKLKEHKDETLHDLVCIMANAPMITRADITGRNDEKLTAGLDQIGLALKEHGDHDRWPVSARPGPSGIVSG